MNLLIFNALSWEQRKLSEVTTEFKSGEGIKADEIEENGTYPVYGGNGLRGYTERYNHDGEYALIGRQGALCGNMNYSVGKAYFTEHAVAVKANKSNDTRFLYYLLDRMDLGRYSDQSAQPGLAVNKLVVLHTYVPRKQEQEAIGVYFKSLDNLITLHQSKAESWKNKKNQLSTISWEQRKFSDLYAPLVERNSDLLPYNKTLSVATMTYKTDGNGAADSSLANYKRLRTGDIAFEGHTSKSFRYGRFVLNDVGDGIMSPRFSALRPLAQMPTNFWKYYIHYEPIMRKILVASTKAGTMMNELVIDEFLKSSVLVPSIEEQTRIGSILKNIDNLITLHHRKLNRTQFCINRSFLYGSF